MTEPQPDAPGRASSSHPEGQVIRRALAAAWRICGMGTRQEIWHEASAELRALTGAAVICLDADRAGRLIPLNQRSRHGDQTVPPAVLGSIADRLAERWRATREPALLSLEDDRVLAVSCTDTRTLRGGLALLTTGETPYTGHDQAVLALMGLATGYALGALATRATSVPLDRHEAALSGRQAELGRTLHSGPAQDLATATLALEHLLSSASGQPLAEEANIALAYVAFAGENLRQFIAQLRAQAPEPGAAPDERSHLAPAPPTGSFFPALGQEEAMLAIVREAIRNSRAHARAETVTITVTRDQGALSVQIADDGHGFAGAAPSGHFGLAEMRELAVAIGGELVISSTPGKGTTIRLTVPEPVTDPSERHVDAHDAGDATA